MSDTSRARDEQGQEEWTLEESRAANGRPELNPHYPDPANPDTYVPSPSPDKVSVEEEKKAFEENVEENHSNVSVQS